MANDLKNLMTGLSALGALVGGEQKAAKVYPARTAPVEVQGEVLLVGGACRQTKQFFNRTMLALSLRDAADVDKAIAYGQAIVKLASAVKAAKSGK